MHCQWQVTLTGRLQLEVRRVRAHGGSIEILELYGLVCPVTVPYGYRYSGDSRDSESDSLTRQILSSFDRRW
jgi:hypothetical protein